MSLLKNTAQPEKRKIFIKIFLITESVIVPVGRERKIRTTLRTNQIAEFVPLISEKKNNILYLNTCCPGAITRSNYEKETQQS